MLIKKAPDKKGAYASVNGARVDPYIIALSPINLNQRYYFLKAKTKLPRTTTTNTK